MKLLTPSLVLAAALSLATTAAADDKKPVTAPQAALVAVMTDTGQAMLWDSNRGEYVVVKLGSTIQGFTVAELGKDQIVLRKGELHYVLPRTTDTKNIGKNAKTNGKTKTTKSDKGAELLDPYPGKEKPIDPYADENIRVVVAPDGVGVAPGPEAPLSPPGATPPSKDTAKKDKPKKDPKPTKVETVPPTVVAPAAPDTELREETYTISRAELLTAMDDFNKLSKEVQADIGKKGIQIKSVARGTFVHRLGLRKGDLVLKVDGKAVTSLDAAAGVYAHLLDATKFTMKVKRGNNLITLRYRLTK
jgi:hypothetical protein